MIGLAEDITGFKPALNSKGLRPMRCSAAMRALELQASPEFKGIKTWTLSWARARMRFKPALNSKGLRLCRSSTVVRHLQLQASPEFKGIKTLFVAYAPISVTLQASPEFKGIKTRASSPTRDRTGRFKPALNSKGLRHHVDAAAHILASSPP